MTSKENIDWNDVIKKEARGSGDEDLGEVQEVANNYVLVQKGMLHKDKFYIPKDQVESYDGSVLRFRVSEEEAKSRFQRDSPPESRYDEPSTMPRREDRTVGKTEETPVSLTEERLNVSKRATQQGEATITKEPYTETKTVEVPLTHEEVTIERRPPSGATKAETPVSSREEIKVPLRKEEVQVTKEPYVKEELSVKKKPVTETRTVSEQVTSEKVKVKGADSGEE
jgi:uncharacterized protein (TIGR02271 family)